MLADGKMDPVIAGKHLVEKKAGNEQEKYRYEDLMKILVLTNIDESARLAHQSTPCGIEDFL
jgi:hypothetical protein